MTREGYKKHNELIEWWSTGTEIEVWDDNTNKWQTVKYPTWNEDLEYRVKKYDPSPGDRVLVQDDYMDQWYERIFVGWDEDYPIVISMTEDGEFNIEDDKISVKTWDRVKELKK